MIRTMMMAVAAAAVLAGSLAAADDLITVNKTQLREKPDSSSTLLVEIPVNTRLVSTERKELWYKVKYTANDKALTGWVSEQDVDNMMGRSKGQLLEENKKLVDEVETLRKSLAEEKAKNATLEKEKAAQAEVLAQERAKSKELEDESKATTAGLKERIEALKTELTEAMAQIKQLKGQQKPETPAPPAKEK